MTVRDVRYHAIQVRGEQGAIRPAIHNVHLMDTGQQLLKSSISGNGQYADEGLVACSRFEYTTSRTVGLHERRGSAWRQRMGHSRQRLSPHSEALNVTGGGQGRRFSAWANSQDTRDRAQLRSSTRSAALRLVCRRSRFVYPRRRTRWIISEAWSGTTSCATCTNGPTKRIEANAASDYRIDHNTVLTLGTTTPWTIGIRFPVSHGLIRNNLTSRPALQRNGARAEFAANVSSAMTDWFRDARQCDLHLVAAARAAIDAGVEIPDVPIDYDRQPRVGKPDVGAFEYRGVPLIGGSR